MKKTTLMIVATALACSIIARSHAAGSSSLKTAIAAADLILKQQDDTGAIAMGLLGQKDNKVISYFSCFAAHGLVDVYSLTRKAKYIDGAKRWVDWYAAHQNNEGAIFDYAWQNGQWIATTQLDSTDSYAAVYVDLLKAIYDASNDSRWLKGFQPSLIKACNAMNMTRQPNGLTTAKPDYPVMYTMDNVEVLTGLRSAAYLFGVLKDSKRANQANNQADETEKAIGGLLWNESAKCYRVGIQTDGGKLEGLKDWYPDIMANLMAVAWLPRSVRNVSLYASLSARFRASCPETANSLDDVEHLVWWGWASAGIDNAIELKRIQKKLNGFERLAQGGCDPGLLGHIARLCCR